MILCVGAALADMTSHKARQTEPDRQDHCLTEALIVRTQTTVHLSQMSSLLHFLAKLNTYNVMKSFDGILNIHFILI